MGGGCQAEPSENLDGDPNSADWTKGLDPCRKVHEPQVAQFLVHQGARSAEGHGSDCGYGVYSLGPQAYLAWTSREVRSASMENARHRRKASGAGSVWRTRGTATAPGERADSAGLREDDGDGEDLEPVAEVLAMVCPDRD